MSGIIVGDCEAYCNAHPELSHYEVIVLDQLAKAANTITRCAYPSVTTLAQKIRCSVSSVQRALRKLEAAKIIRSSGALSRLRTNIYQIIVPRRNSSKCNGSCPLPNPYKPEKERKIFAHAHTPEVEIRQKTNDELNQLPKSIESAHKFGSWIARTLGKGFADLCNNENAQINLS